VLASNAAIVKPFLLLNPVLFWFCHMHGAIGIKLLRLQIAAL